MKIAVVGAGLIGSSWAAEFLANGHDVVAFDVAPGADDRLEAYVRTFWPALEKVGLADGASMNRLHFTSDLQEAVGDADLVQENGPERLELKRELFAKLDGLTRPDAIIASSSSGLTMSTIQSACVHHPERCLIAHPFNPPHLIPLVEIVGGSKTSKEAIDRAMTFYRSIGKRPIRVNKELPGHVANRIAFALYREVIHLIAEDVVSVEDADTAVSWGPGLRWGIMGPSMLYELGAGEGGIREGFNHFMPTFLTVLESLGEPRITSEVLDKIAAGVKAQVQGQTIEKLAAHRDEVLLGLLELRKQEK